MDTFKDYHRLFTNFNDHMQSSYPHSEQNSNSQVLKNHKKTSARPKRKPYNKVSNQNRDKLIKIVVSKAQSMRQVRKLFNESLKSFRKAAKSLGMNYSTAKSIITVYRQSGRRKRKNCARLFENLAPIDSPLKVSQMETMASSMISNDAFCDIEVTRKKFLEFDLSSLGDDHEASERELKIEFSYKELEEVLQNAADF
jgi:hypothetical protein